MLFLKILLAHLVGDLKESKDRKLTEYILIGTLLSFGIAILTAILTAILYLKLIRNFEDP